jgi:hypothetical protein
MKHVRLLVLAYSVIITNVASLGTLGCFWWLYFEIEVGAFTLVSADPS